MRGDNEFTRVWGVGGNIGQVREGLVGLCVDAGIHRMSEAFELRSGYCPAFRQAHCDCCEEEKEEPGQRQKDV